MESIRQNALKRKIDNDLTGDIFNRIDILPNIPQPTLKKSYAVAVVKFGLNTVKSYEAIRRSVPGIWPANVIDQLISFDENIHNILSSFDFGLSEIADLAYIGPPIGDCYECRKPLILSNKPTNIRYVCADGQIQMKKHVTLRCRRCSINYKFDKYGNKSSGYQFYSSERPAIAASDSVYVDRALYNLQWSFSQHCWVSFEGMAEAYSHAFDIPKNQEIDRRTWASCLWWGEVEAELRELNVDFKFKNDADLEKCMSFLDDKRKEKPYPHPQEDCTDECKARGCGKLFVADGLWKLQFAHCMFSTQIQVRNMPLIGLPAVCTAQPKAGQAFCITHCLEMEEANVPTSLREFIKYCTHGEVPELEEECSSVANPCDHTYSQSARNILQEQDCKDIYHDFPEIVTHVGATNQTSTSRCNKDLGERDTMRQMSRGHMFVVRAGGHIDAWTPLYRSESHGQVLLFLIAWLYSIFKDVAPSEWSKTWLAYDNMCQLLRTRVAKTDLPLPAPYNKMFKSVNKVIDAMHIKNHIQDSCLTDLHPDNIYDMYPELQGSRNTQAAEQTFVWLGRYKKILCSMPKVHHLFYLHRLVKRRNSYIADCYAKGKKPLLPSIRNNKTT